MSTILNTNTLHNVLNVVMAVTAAGTAFLIATGCTATAGVLECSQSWMNPAYTTGAIAVLAASKTLINVVRDGFSGLTKPQPPVDKGS